MSHQKFRSFAIIFTLQHSISSCAEADVACVCKTVVCQDICGVSSIYFVQYYTHDYYEWSEWNIRIYSVFSSSNIKLNASLLVCETGKEKCVWHLWLWKCDTISSFFFLLKHVAKYIQYFILLRKRLSCFFLFEPTVLLVNCSFQTEIFLDL